MDSGLLNINGQDAFTTYGLLLAEGAYNELWKLPVAKPGYTHDWPDQDGIETDPDEEPAFARMTYSIPILLIGPTEGQFWIRYNAFLAFLVSAKEFSLDVLPRGRRFRVRHSSISGFNELLEYTNHPAAHFIWQLTNDHPAQIIPIP